MHQRALEGFEKVLRVEHSHTLTSVSQVGLMLYKEAVDMGMRAMETTQRVFRHEHPHNAKGHG